VAGSLALSLKLLAKYFVSIDVFRVVHIFVIMIQMFIP